MLPIENLIAEMSCRIQVFVFTGLHKQKNPLLHPVRGLTLGSYILYFENIGLCGRLWAGQVVNVCRMISTSQTVPRELHGTWTSYDMI